MVLKILVIKFKAMGDVILASSICDSLRVNFPRASIEILTYSPYCELFANHPCIDVVHSLDKVERQNPLDYFKALKILRSRKYDVVIDAQGTAKSQLVSVFCNRAKYRIGRDRGRWIEKYAYTHLVKKPHRKVDKLKERLRLVKPLESECDLKHIESISLAPTFHERRFIQKKLEELGLDQLNNTIAFYPTSKERQKQWCRRSTVNLIEYCRDKYGAQILLFAGLPEEQETLSLIRSEIVDHTNIFFAPSPQTIRCLPALLSLCDMFIGNEGGPRHIAQAVGLPTFSIFSPHANKDEWLPTNCPFQQGIEWRDVVESPTLLGNFEYGDSNYFRLYNSISLEHVTQKLDEFVASVNHSLYEKQIAV